MSKMSGLGLAMLAYPLALARMDLAQEAQMKDCIAVTSSEVLVVPDEARSECAGGTSTSPTLGD